MAGITQKLSLYANELMFSARAPHGLSDKLRLAISTLDFHLGNWRKRPVDPRPRLKVVFSVDGYGSSITLRPRDGDLAIFHEIFVRGAYDIPAELLPPESVRTVVDLGANVGFASLYFAGRYRNAKVFSVEPHPDNFALLRENVRSEERITSVQACATGKPDQEVFITTDGRSSHFHMNTSGDGAKVRGVSISQLCDEQSIDQIDLLKVDIEGAEAELFADASFLSRVRVIAAELHGEYNLDLFNADLSKWGFQAWINERSVEEGLVLAARI